MEAPDLVKFTNLYQGLYIVLSFSIKHILYTIVFSKNVSLQLKIQFHIGSIGGSFESNKDIFIPIRLLCWH